MDTKNFVANWAQRFDLSKEKIFHLKQQKGGSKGVIDQSSQKDLRILTYCLADLLFIFFAFNQNRKSIANFIAR